MNIRFIDSKNNILNLLFICFEWPFWKEFLFFYEYTVEIPTLEYRVDWKILDIYLRSINGIKLYYIYSSKLKTSTVDLKMFNHFTTRNIEIRLMIINLMTCKDYTKFRYDYVKNTTISIRLFDFFCASIQKQPIRIDRKYRCFPTYRPSLTDASGGSGVMTRTQSAVTTKQDLLYRQSSNQLFWNSERWQHWR